MHIGICTIRLRLPENHDLKGKRQIIRPIVERVRGKFNVSIAEVEEQDKWQMAVLGLTCVNNDAARAHEMLEGIVKFIEQQRLDAGLVDYEIEVLTA